VFSVLAITINSLMFCCVNHFSLKPQQFMGPDHARSLSIETETIDIVEDRYGLSSPAVSVIMKLTKLQIKPLSVINDWLI